MRTDPNNRQTLRHNPSSRARGLAAVLVVAFVGSNLGTYLHEATERHARCPEHGEVIHVAGEATTPWAPDDTTGQESTDPSARTPAPDALGHDHDHCYLCPTTRERAVVLAPQPVAVATATTAVRSTIPDHAAIASSDVYALAPKTSPPA